MLVATYDTWGSPAFRSPTSPRRIVGKSKPSRFRESANIAPSVRQSSPKSLRATSPPARSAVKYTLIAETPRRERTGQGSRKGSKISHEQSAPALHSQSMAAPVQQSASYVPFPATLPGLQCSEPLSRFFGLPSPETSCWKWAPVGPSVTPRAAGTARACRILCYGDSLTAGFCQGGRQYQPYAASLAEALTMGGAACEVGVCGLVGHTARSMVLELSSANCRDITGRHGKGLVRILDEDKPIDLVLLIAGTNDLGSGSSPHEIADDICALHAVCHARGVPTISIAPPTVICMKKRHIRANRDQLADMLAARIGSRVGGDDGVLAHFDAEELLPRIQSSMYWEPDQIHFSAIGSVHLGKLLASWILPAVLDAFCPAKSSSPVGTPTHLSSPRRNLTQPNTPLMRFDSESEDSVKTGEERTQWRLQGSAIETRAAQSLISPSSPVSSCGSARTPTWAPDSVSPVEVWSKTHDVWCKGILSKMDGTLANVEYILPSGGLATKQLAIDHRELRVLSQGITVTSTSTVVSGAVNVSSPALLSPAHDFRQILVH